MLSSACKYSKLQAMYISSRASLHWRCEYKLFFTWGNSGTWWQWEALAVNTQEFLSTFCWQPGYFGFFPLHTAFNSHTSKTSDRDEYSGMNILSTKFELLFKFSLRTRQTITTSSMSFTIFVFCTLNKVLEKEIVIHMWKYFTFWWEFSYSADSAAEYDENTFEISPQEKSRASNNILTAKRIRKEPQPPQSSSYKK